MGDPDGYTSCPANGPSVQRRKTAFTGDEPHCFAPWYLHQRFQLSDAQAMEQSSDGNYDFGVDAFQLNLRFTVGDTANHGFTEAAVALMMRSTSSDNSNLMFRNSSAACAILLIYLSWL